MKGVLRIGALVEFQRYVNSGTGYILITDRGRNEPNKIHFVEFNCSGIKDCYFTKKVVKNAEENGKYFYGDKIIPLVECAQFEMPQKPVKICGNCCKELRKFCET